MADALYFNSMQNRNIYMNECMTDGICPTPYIIGNSADAPVVPEQSHREKIRRSLQMDGMQTILYAPLLPGSYVTDSAQTFRNFMSALYIIDQELEDHQVMYLHLDGEKQLDYSVFTHVREMPSDFDVSDFASACDFFVSDYHSALSAKYSPDTQVLRFLCTIYGKQHFKFVDFNGNERIVDEFFQDFAAFSNAPQLVRYIGQEEQQVSDAIQQSSFQITNRLVRASAKAENGIGNTLEEQYLITDIVDFLLHGRPLPYYESQVAPASSALTAAEAVCTARFSCLQPAPPPCSFLHRAQAFQEPDPRFQCPGCPGSGQGILAGLQRFPEYGLCQISGTAGTGMFLSASEARSG